MNEQKTVRRRFHVYRLSDGMLTGESFSLSTTPGIDEHVARCTPEGCALFEALDRPDVLSQRIDVQTGELVDYQPPQPSADHEWNEISRRWVLSQHAQTRNARRQAAQARIDELERRQARRVRELLAAQDPQLKQLDDEIAALRSDLT